MGCDLFQNPSYTMNPYRTALLTLAVTASGFALAQLSSLETPPAARQTTASPAEEYRVLDVSMLPVKAPKDTSLAVENALNELGAQGWRVRAGTGTMLVLAK
jgi:hypothetical protein